MKVFAVRFSGGLDASFCWLRAGHGAGRDQRSLALQNCAARRSAVHTAAGRYAAPDKSKIVYVSDFELDAVDVNGKLPEKRGGNSPLLRDNSNRKKRAWSRRASGAAGGFMSATLVKELERAGFTAHRLRPGDTRPTDGIRISGISASPMSKTG